MPDLPMKQAGGEGRAEPPPDKTCDSHRYEIRVFCSSLSGLLICLLPSRLFGASIGRCAF
eukprot:8429179-Alexandrium_andersonii.AAC.1